MKYYLAGIVLILGLAVFIAIKDHRAAQEVIRHSANLGKATTDVEKSAQNPRWDNIGWSEFFRWPNGTATCAVILTLLAIAWQSNETRKAAQAARESVGVANSEYALAERTAKQELRAYMCVSKTYAIIHEGRGVEFYVRFRNSGQTPAYNFEGIQRSGISVYPIPDAPVRVLPSTKSSGMTGAGDAYHIRFWVDPAIRLSHNELIEAISDDQVLYMSGIYTYEDIFGDKHTLHIQQIAGGPTSVRGTNMKDEPGQMSITLYADEVGNYEEKSQP